MYDTRLRGQARTLRSEGRTHAEIVRALHVSATSVHRWLSGERATDTCEPPRCWVCDREEPDDVRAGAYAYLLGQYLGDGHLVTSARVPVLRIYACTDYPAMVDQIRAAVRTVRGTVPGLAERADSARMVAVQSYWKHWPCVLPQHGPGRKHERPIALTGWQRDLVDAHPWPLIRGLIHSNGCRAINNVVTRGRAYSYPRYFFANESSDILHLLGETLDRVGVEWRFNRPNSLSIARRRSVAALEVAVGPKR